MSGLCRAELREAFPTWSSQFWSRQYKKGMNSRKRYWMIMMRGMKRYES